MLPSILIHERGWYSRTHLGASHQTVSKFAFGANHFLIISKAPNPSTIQPADRNIIPPEGSQFSAGVSCMSNFILVTGRFLDNDLLASTIQTSGRDKFSPINHPFAPFSIPAWSAGLRAVDQSPACLVETSKTQKRYGCYTFPDPGLFINPATAAKYFQSWLQVRDAWFMRVVKEPSLAMSNQNWRSFLSIDLDVLGKEKTKAARRRQESLEMIFPKSNMYPEVKMRRGLAGPIIWQGKDYPREVLLPDAVVREILWELFEVNFIHEFQSLDRRACANLDISDTAQLFERQIMISQCFHPSSFRHVPIPSQNLGLAADNVDDRFHFVTNLVLVMKSWRGDKPVILGASVDSLRGFSRKAREEMEKCVAKYYCQQFFNYFGRAAQIPHRLFDHE